MAQPYFIFKNIYSYNKSLWVTELPPPTRAEERVDVIQIPGKAGHVTIKQGDDIHNSHLMECVVTAPYTADFSAILAWLSGSGTLIFSNDSSRVYEAEITAEVVFNKISNSLKQATIPFFVQPHKAQTPEESATTITGSGDSTSGSITNPGDVASFPLVEITYSGTLQVNIGDSAMAFTSIPGKIIVDCEAGIITTSDGEWWDGVYSGDFFKIKVGANTVTANKACTIKITPRWRWK